MVLAACKVTPRVHGERVTVTPAQRPRSRRIAQSPPRRGCTPAIRARHPFLPARLRSLRSVSRILTSPPQQDKRARSGSRRLHSAQTKGGGDKYEKKKSNKSSHRTHDRGRCKQNQCRCPGKVQRCRAPRGSSHTAPCLPGGKPASKFSGHRPRVISPIRVSRRPAAGSQYPATADVSGRLAAGTFSGTPTLWTR